MLSQDTLFGAPVVPTKHEDCHVQLLSFAKKTLPLAILAVAFAGCVGTTEHQQYSQAVQDSATEPHKTAGQAVSAIEASLKVGYMERLSREIRRIVDIGSRSTEPEATQAPAQIAKKHIPLGAAISAAIGHDRKKIQPVVSEIKKSAVDHGVPATLLAALIQRESSFRQSAVSKSGAIGLSQIMPKIWGRHCKSITTISGNVDCGAKVLSIYYQETGSWEKALAFYNVGPGNYSKSQRMRSIGYRYANDILKSQKGIERELALLTE